MQKEKLTRENIKNDLFKLYNWNAGSIIGAVIFTAVFTMLVFWAFYAMKFKLIYVFIPTMFIFLTCIYLFGHDIYTRVVKTNAIKADKFIIETDELIESIEGHSYGPKSHRRDKPFILRFYSGSEFHMYEKNDTLYYSWSKMFPLKCRGVYNYAHKGDIYYTVCLNNPKKADMAYNTRMFDLVYEAPKAESEHQTQKHDVDS